MQQQSYNIVVAHFYENLDWLLPFDEDSIIVYSKGEWACAPCIQKVLPNVGREAHTYLSYIIEYYENLPDIVFFTQGKIDDTPHPNSDKLQDIEDTFLTIDKYSKNYTYQWFYNGLDSSFHVRFWKSAVEPFSQNGKEFFNTYVNNSINLDKEKVYWYVGAIFSVRREAILSRSKEYYKNLLNLLADSKHPEVAHFLERSWFYVFNLDKF